MGDKGLGPPPTFPVPIRPEQPPPATRGNGRPGWFTQKRRDEFCERLIAGESVRAICASPWMPYEREIYSRYLQDEGFRAQYTQARAVALERWEDELIEIADDGSNDYTARMTRSGDTVLTVDTDHINRSRLRVDTRKWIMAKRAPKKYGDRVQTDVAGTLTLEALVSAAAAPPKLPDGSATVAGVVEGEDS